MYGLIGYPLGHSFSADFFNTKFKNEGIDESYHLFPLEKITDFPDILHHNPGLKGLNVTIPYKEKILPYLTEVSEEASEIGAVNVIKISEDGKLLKGYNSDAVGFHNSIKPLLKPYMKRALVLGTGGASRAVAYVLNKLGLEVIKVSRNRNNINIAYSDISKETIDTHHVIVNTTPLGMWPDIERCPDIPYQWLTDKHLCYDLVYNPEVTLFMKKASEMGAEVKNGLEMLHLQALGAWDIWSGK